MVDLADLDFGEGSPQLKVDLVGKLSLEGGIAGDVGGQFEDAGPMVFLSFQAIEQLEAMQKA